MCRKSIYLASLIIALSLTGYLSAAEVDAEIPQIGFPKPILDGVMDDVWLYSTEQFITNTNTGAEPTSPADGSGSWWALWDPEYLYLLVNVNDEALVQDSDPGQGWLDDRIEIFIDGDNSKDDATDGSNDYQYCFRWNHGIVEIPVEWYLSPGSLQGVEYGVTTTDTGYIVEVKLSWLTMIGRLVQLDRLIGIDVAIDDDDDGGDVDTQFSWYMDVDGGSPHVPNLWGTAMLVAGSGEPWPYASMPKPADGDLLETTWATLSWVPASRAVSHDIYFGDNFDDVNDGTQDSDVFWSNETLTFYVAGLSGYACPDGLVPGTTYYWRIDEVNEAEPNSPWKGDIWSFSVPPNSAYSPVPVNGAELVSLNATLTWTAGYDAILHTVYFGEDFDDVNNAADGPTQGLANYTPDSLKLAKTYYWRVDEYDGDVTHKGDVWSFTTEGAVSGPNPADGAVGVKPSVILKWDAGTVASSHEVYFGTDAEAVANATKASLEYKEPKALGDESYDPGKLTLNTAYFWRIDEVNAANPDGPWAGKVWSFTTGDYFVIDDFEIYDANENQIWWEWKDGLGYVAHGTEPAYPGNGTGSAVGDENIVSSYMEETIVHGGLQSLPLFYDNNKAGYTNYYSEAELTLMAQRDWTEEGVAELSIWFCGDPSNAPEPMYVAVSNIAGAPAVVYHGDPGAANVDIWTEWPIPLQDLADLGLDLTDVDSIAIGLGTQGNITIPGGLGKMLFDDIRLNLPSETAEQ